jgi:hypothetical protein
MTDPDIITVRADELRLGDYADLANDPHDFLRDEPYVDSELIEVAQVKRKGEAVSVGYETVGFLFQTFDYDPGHTFNVLRRDIDPERFNQGA